MVGPPPSRLRLPGRRYTRPDRREEASMRLVINLIYLAGIVLVPVGIAALFIRLSRRFMSS
jgi:hypothetical protein